MQYKIEKEYYNIYTLEKKDILLLTELASCSSIL